MALTDTALRKAKPAAKALKLANEGGLYLFHAEMARHQALAQG